MTLFFSISVAYSQNTHSRLTTLSGGSAYFSFNSINKMNNGISYSSWTRYNVYYIDSLNDGTILPAATWALEVRSNTPTIEGNGANFMDLNKIEIQISTTIPGVNVPDPGWVIVTNSDVILLDTGPNPTNIIDGEVVISYRVGSTNIISGEIPDNYTCDLIFNLRKE